MIDLQELDPEESEKKYLELRSYEDNQTDLLHAYGKLKHIIGAASAGADVRGEGGKEVISNLVVRIATNPAFRSEPHDFIKRALEEVSKSL